MTKISNWVRHAGNETPALPGLFMDPGWPNLSLDLVMVAR